MSSDPESTVPAKVSLGWSFWVMIIVVMIATKLAGLLGGALIYGLWWLGGLAVEKLRAEKN